MSSPREGWETPASPPALRAGATHVWRIPLDRSTAIEPHLAVLSDDEQERVRRFHFAHHGRRYAIAHGVLRRILAAYAGVDPQALAFTAGEHGKPALVPGGVIAPEALHFNLSHSGEMALLAVAQHGAVGVDVERWRNNVHPLDIAERFFSPYERDALRALGSDNPDAEPMLRGFFSTWSRKEAYLKATGHGIARGLHHFDVTMDIRADLAQPSDAEPSSPHTTSEPLSWAHMASPPSQPLSASPVVQPARLLADRLDPRATERWCMTHLDVGPGYSGALVSSRVANTIEGAVVLYESPYI